MGPVKERRLDVSNLEAPRFLGNDYCLEIKKLGDGIFLRGADEQPKINGKSSEPRNNVRSSKFFEISSTQNTLEFGRLQVTTTQIEDT